MGRGGEAEMPQNTALRGTRYNDSFIPPKPMEAPSGAGPYISSFTGAHVPEQVEQPVASMPSAPAPTAPQTNAAPGLTLNPPKQPQKTEQRRSPSLFERITGSVQEHLEGITDQLGTRPHIQQPSRQRVAPSASSRPLTAPSQGSLAIDAPSAKPADSEDQLDIPAFLRRQAN